MQHVAITFGHAKQLCNAVWTILFPLLYPVPLLGLHLRQAAIALKGNLMLFVCCLQVFACRQASLL